MGEFRVRWWAVALAGGIVVAVALAVVGWVLAPGLYPVPPAPPDRPEVAATQRAASVQAVVATRASILAALAGLGALVTIAINLRNAMTQVETLRETVRSYAAAEADRARDIAQREAAARDAADDARARRVTELYARAVDQLGAERAPVRLGGIYALERLAQDTPDQRLTVANVLCAYLRMPWEPSDDPASAQEREVRRTAQRVLAVHLRWPRDEPEPPERYWDGLRIDLVGAVLVDADFTHARPMTARFDRAVFVHRASFAGATFRGQAWFADATFDADAQFARATFHGRSHFDRASIAGAAHFTDARANPDARHTWPEGWRLSGDVVDDEGYTRVVAVPS